MALSLLAANNAQTVLAAGISSTATSLTVNAGTGTLFPSPVAGTSFFKLTIIDAATGSLTEIVHVTARAGDVFTIQRGQEGTVPRAWSANDIAANMMTAGTLSYILGNFQPLDPTLTALAALVGVANKLPYFNGDDTAALTDLTQVGRDIIGKSSIADILTYLGLSPFTHDQVTTWVMSPNNVFGLNVNNNGDWGCGKPGSSGFTALAVLAGGTGATSASEARDNLGITTLLNGKQPKDDTLTALSGKNVNGLLAYLGFESGSGWSKLPEGFTIQRLRVGLAAGQNTTAVTFPRAFTSVDYVAQITWSDISGGNANSQSPSNVGIVTGSRTSTGMSVWQAGPGGFNLDILVAGY